VQLKLSEKEERANRKVAFSNGDEKRAYYTYGEKRRFHLHISTLGIPQKERKEFLTISLWEKGGGEKGRKRRAMSCPTFFLFNFRDEKGRGERGDLIFSTV